MHEIVDCRWPPGVYQRERERVTDQCRISYRNIYLRFTFAMRNCTSTLWIAFRAWKLLRSAFQILFWFQFGIVLVHNYYLEPPEQRSKTTMRGNISWLLFLNYSREKNTDERGRKCERHKIRNDWCSNDLWSPISEWLCSLDLGLEILLTCQEATIIIMKLPSCDLLPVSECIVPYHLVYMELAHRGIIIISIISIIVIISFYPSNCFLLRNS